MITITVPVDYDTLSWDTSVDRFGEISLAETFVELKHLDVVVRIEFNQWEDIIVPAVDRDTLPENTMVRVRLYTEREIGKTTFLRRRITLYSVYDFTTCEWDHVRRIYRRDGTFSSVSVHA
jgi:hypothetical protein